MSNPAPQINSLQLYRRLLGYTRVYALRFALGLLAIVLFALTEPLIPALLKPLLDGTFVERDPQHVFWMPILVVLLTAFRGLTNFASQIAFAWVAARVVYDLRRQMFERVLALPTRYFDSTATGNLLSKLTYNVSQVMNAATDVLTVLVRDTLSVLGLLAYIFWLNWRLSLLVLLIIPAIAWVIKLFARRLRSLHHKLQTNMGDVTHVLEESIRGQKVVKIYEGANYERQRFDVQSNRARLLFYKVKVAAAANTPLVELLGAMAMGATIYLAVLPDWGGGDLTVGGFVSFFGAIALMFSPLKRLTKINSPLQRGLAAAESIFGLLDEQGEPDTGTRRLPRVTGEIELQGVSFAYEAAGNTILRDLGLHIHSKEMVALVGRSGSGKSTLVSLLPRLYDPTAGCILLDGIDIREVPLADLRTQIALVSQDVTLFNDTIAANIAYGLDPQPPEQQIREAAQASHALEFIDRLPEGLATRIGEDGLRLSGGQRQRIALARALLKDAPILILDEATSALDTESERAIQASLQEQRHRRTTIVIAHRLSTVERADRILVMDQGRIVETGTHQELLALGRIYAGLHQTGLYRP